MNSLDFRSPFGNFSILMRDDHAPRTCEYFLDLAREGVLDQSSVFRIVARNGRQPEEPCPIDIVQIGPLDNFFETRHPIVHENTKQTGLSHLKWTVSAARFDLGELYGSFFICLSDEPELDYGGSRQPDGQGFAAFGCVTAGFQTIERIFEHAESDEMLARQIPLHGVTITDTPVNPEPTYDQNKQ